MAIPKGTTVDDSNPAPVDRWFIPFTFYTSQVVSRNSAINSSIPTLELVVEPPI